jgi:hypothetical protein
MAEDQTARRRHGSSGRPSNPALLPDGLGAVNVYALAASECLTLVYAVGVSAKAGRNWNVPRSISSIFADISSFLIGYVHRDHCALAVNLRSEFGDRVALGRRRTVGLEELTNPP